MPEDNNKPKTLSDLPKLSNSQQGSPTVDFGSNIGNAQLGNTSFGDSKYDKGYSPSLDMAQSGEYQFARGEQQNAFGQIGLGVLRAGSKALVEFAKTPAYLYSLGEWAGRNMQGEDYSLASALDNSMLNWLENADESVKNEIPVYKSYKSGTGGIWDNIMSTSFWASDGADGVGYLLGMMGPGMLLKSANMAGAISRLGVGAKTAANMELGTQTMLNTFVESAAEAKGVADRLKGEGASDEAIANAARETFIANMGVLLLPNMLANKAILGRADKGMDIINARYRDAAGKLISNPTKRQALREYGKSFAAGVMSEGLVEEGSQTSIENYEVNKALGKTDKGFVDGFLEEYVNTLNTTEGQKSIVLGAAIGGISQIAGKYKEHKNEDKLQPTISGLIERNFEGFSVDQDIFERHEDGTIIHDENDKPIINTEKAVNVAKELAAEIRETKLADFAATENNETLHDYIKRMQLARWAVPFFQQGEMGVGLLNEHIDNAKNSKHFDQEAEATNALGSKFDASAYAGKLKAEVASLHKAYEANNRAVDSMSFLNKIKTTKENMAYLPKYLERVSNSMYQERVKQSFLTDKINGLMVELSKITPNWRDKVADAFSFPTKFDNVSPEDQAVVDNIKGEMESLTKMLKGSLEASKDRMNLESHQKGFEEFASRADTIKDNIKKATKEQETKEKKTFKPEEEEIDFKEMLNTALGAENIQHFNFLNEQLQKHVDLTATDKAALEAKKASFGSGKTMTIDEINAAAGVTNAPETTTQQPDTQEPVETPEGTVVETVTFDQDEDTTDIDHTVGETLSNVTDANENQETQANTLDVEPTEYTEAVNGKLFNKQPNVVMMHIYDHIIRTVNGVKRFFFKKGPDGGYILDNKSKLDIKAMSDVRRGDILDFEFEEWPEGLKAEYEKLEDFDGENIVIKFKGKRIGHVQQPHPVSEEGDPKQVAFSKAMRDSLVQYRRDIISKLKKGEAVKEEVHKKTNGGLYAKFQSSGPFKGSIALVNNVLSDFRPKDKVGNILVFCYANKEGKIEFKKGSLTEKQEQVIERHVGKYANFKFREGMVFQLVQDISGGWSVIPVYANRMTDTAANGIVEELKKFDNNSPTLDVYKAINPYVYASNSRTKASVFVTVVNDVLTLRVNTFNFPLDSINNNSDVRAKFIEALMTQRQNISVKNINNAVEQQKLRDRNAIATNVVRHEVTDEYFVQPYIEYTRNNFIFEAVTPQEKAAQEAPQENTDIQDVKKAKSREDLKKLLEQKKKGNKGGGYVSSTTVDLSKLDKPAFEKWLSKNLPQLSLAEAKAVAEVPGTLVDSFGAYKDMLIYLFNRAGQRTAFHEAFHGVFRNMMTIKQKHEIMRSAMEKYPKPTIENIVALDKQYPGHTTKELRYLYYEEKLADDFAEFTYNYNNRGFIAKLGRAIADFFNKILSLFGAFSVAEVELVEAFKSINKGNFKNAKIVPYTNEYIDIINREILDEFAFSRELEGVFPNPTLELRTINSIGNRFVALYQDKIANGEKVEVSKIYRDIFNVFNETVEKMTDNIDAYNVDDIEAAIGVVENESKIKAAVNKFLSERKFNIKAEKTTETAEQLIPDTDLGDEEDEFVGGEDKGVNRGLSDAVSISGLSSASTRLKMFMSSIPVLENGVHKKDVFGVEQYHDFNSLYYYVENHLTGVYTLKDQIILLHELSESRPELLTVINKLGYQVYVDNNISEMEDQRNIKEIPVQNITTEKLQLLRNDFKTNFTKQQLAYTLVKFNINKRSGDTSYEIIESNRKALGLEVMTTWQDNLIDPTKDTIAEHKGGKTTIFRTKAAEKLVTDWAKIANAKPTASQLNKVLLKVGIEYSPEALDAIVKDEAGWVRFRKDAGTYIRYFNEKEPERHEASARKALRRLVRLETDVMLNNYTSSFNDVENKNIYSIQLPSFASKRMAIINSDDETRFINWLEDMQRDPMYKYSNLLSQLKSDSDFRKTEFKLSFLDGLKDKWGDSKGSKFTNMNPKDFMSMQVALFQNAAANQKAGEGEGKKQGNEISKIMYITPSDKTMAMIFDMIKYGVMVEFNEKGLHQIKRGSDIMKPFYNVFLGEVARIKNTIDFRNALLENRGKDRNKPMLTDVLEHYHVTSGKGTTSWVKLHVYIEKQKAGLELTDNDWNAIKELFDGEAFGIGNFEEKTSKGIDERVLQVLEEAPAGADVELLMESNLFDPNALKKDQKSIKHEMVTRIQGELTREYHSTLAEMGRKGLISGSNGSYGNVSLQLKTKTMKKGSPEVLKENAQKINYEIINLAAEFACNTLLANIEMSTLLNGDKAQYKPGDIQKRTYQSQSMVTNNNFNEKHIKTIVVKDVKAKSESITDLVDMLKEGMSEDDIKKLNLDDYFGKINVTDAQVVIMPSFFKRILVARGIWNDEIKEAFDIADGKKVGNIPASLRMLAAAIKPFYYGNRFDEKLGIQRYEQVKCAMIPAFKQYCDINPLLAEKRKEMEFAGAEMLAHESSFKAAIGYRGEITDALSHHNIINLEADNFGIQVDNPVHSTDEENNSMRQLKMLLLGSVDPAKEYKSVSGRKILDSIMAMEASNIRASMAELRKELDTASNTSFSQFVKDMVTKRGATTNVEEILNIIAGEFEYPLDNGILSTQLENLLSSIFTNNVIKQAFAGDARVQATSLGVKFDKMDSKDLLEQQAKLTKEQRLLQQKLKWIRPDGKGHVEYAECLMPAWAGKFFDKNGFLKDVNSIPANLREMIVYRIPTEGLHSMLPIRVVGFLPETMGNFILLPYEVTTQMGADFDFDKLYFINKEFYTDGSGQFTEYEYIEGEEDEDIRRRWNQYVKYTSENRLDQLDKGDWQVLSVDEQNVRAARNNVIINNYLTLLTAKENLHLLIKPSGFDKMSKIKDKFFPTRDKDNFFSSRAQRDYKDRNHTGIALKGQSALHVSGHSYATMMPLRTDKYIKDTATGEERLDLTSSINFNDKNFYEFNKLYTLDDSLIADELSSIMAAILDDIKNPILADLNITKNTIDVLATIVRAGYNIDTAIKFVSQLGVKELSKKLDLNTAKIKERGQGWFTTADMIKEYQNELKAIIGTAEKPGKIKPEDLNSEEVQEALSLADSASTNIDDKELDKFIHPETGYREVKDISKANAKEKLLYYAFQIRVLKNFANIQAIAEPLTEINKFFGINKEVGPNVEDILAKGELLNNIMDIKNPIRGFDMSLIPTLNETWKVHQEALEFFSKYFPYGSDYYMSVKRAIYEIQGTKTLDKVPTEDRQFINGFIRYYHDTKDGYFGNIHDTYQRIFVSLPKLLSDIKNLDKGKETLNGVTYESIRNNPFIKNIQKSFEEANPTVQYIQMKGNRLDLQVKNNIIAAFDHLWKEEGTHNLALDFIDHAFASSGFFSGLNNYSAYIRPSHLKDLGYMNERKDRIKMFNSGVMPTYSEILHIADQLIRNNPKPYTKSFEADMFIDAGTRMPIDVTIKLPEIIFTTKDIVTSSNRTNDMQTRDPEIPPRYIRIYDNIAQETTLYKIKSLANGIYVYQKVTLLGKKGYMMEVDANRDLTESFLAENNFNTPESEQPKSKEESSAQATDPIQQPLLEQTALPEPEITPEQRAEALKALTEGQPDLTKEDLNKLKKEGENDDPIDINCKT